MAVHSMSEAINKYLSASLYKAKDITQQHIQDELYLKKESYSVATTVTHWVTSPIYKKLHNYLNNYVKR